MSAKDHITSLMFIEALRTGKFNRDLLLSVEREIYKIKKEVSELHGFSTIVSFVMLFLVSFVMFGYTAHVIVDEIKDPGKVSKLEKKRKVELRF